MIPDEPPFELAVVPHTGCGTRFPPTPHSGPPFPHATGLDMAVPATKAAADPAVTVRADVKQLLSSPRVPP
jgi:carbonic anhydrase